MEGRRSAKQPAPEDYVDEFREALVPGGSIAQHVDELSEARRLWQQSWHEVTHRGFDDAVGIFTNLFAVGEDAPGQDVWQHPVTEEAKELTLWRSSYGRLTQDEQLEWGNRLVETLRHLEASSDADERLFEEWASRLPEPPLALVTATLSSLDPERFMFIHEKTVRILEHFNAKRLPNGIGHYVELNRLARRSAEALASKTEDLLSGRPSSDRFAAFARWLIAEKKAPLTRSRFTVKREMYKDWPPMW